MVNEGEFEVAVRRALKAVFRSHTAHFVRLIINTAVERGGSIASVFLRHHVYPGFNSISRRIKREQAEGRLLHVKADAAGHAILFALFSHNIFMHVFHANRIPGFRISARDVDLYIDLWLRSLRSDGVRKRCNTLHPAAKRSRRT